MDADTPLLFRIYSFFTFTLNKSLRFIFLFKLLTDNQSREFPLWGWWTGCSRPRKKEGASHLSKHTRRILLRKLEFSVSYIRENMWTYDWIWNVFDEMSANLKNTLLLSAWSEVHVISINSDDKKDFNKIFRFILRIKIQRYQ